MKLFAAGMALLLLGGCADYTPKPRGYMRIEPPEARYVPYSTGDGACSFLISDQATVEPAARRGWITIAYPSFDAKLYCSYFPTTPAKLDDDIRECRDLVSRNAGRAKGILERGFSNPDAGVYGLLFLIDGDSAAPVQFALTDSTHRFFRGALYYGCSLNADSLAPVTDYLQADVEAMIESFRWGDASRWRNM